jgi:predicted dehydrogenase
VAAGLNGGGVTQVPNAYLVDVRNGATMLTISFGHTIDAVLYALGQEPRELAATTANQRKSVQVVETGEMIPMTAEDQVAVTGVLENDAVFSAHFYGGMPRDTSDGFAWHIHGSKGDLKMTAMAGLIQMFDVTVHGTQADNVALKVLEVPGKYRRIPNAEGFAQNIAQAFQRMAADIRNGTTTCPTFDDAVTRHRMIAAIQEAAKTGRKQTLT